MRAHLAASVISCCLAGCRVTADSFIGVDAAANPTFDVSVGRDLAIGYEQFGDIGERAHVPNFVYLSLRGVALGVLHDDRGIERIAARVQWDATQHVSVQVIVPQQGELVLAVGFTLRTSWR